MLTVAAFIMGALFALVWWYLGMVGYVYYTNLLDEREYDDELTWSDWGVWTLIYASLLGPIVWIIGERRRNQ
jgi:hypothetical protein